jgi:hypothetical protein
MTRKAEDFIRRRQAQLLGQVFTGEALPGHLVRRADGVVLPARIVHGVSFYGDQMRGPQGHLRVETREVLASGERGPWVTHEDDHNLVVTQAERLMANAMGGVLNSALNYIELGDPTFPANPPGLSDIALQQTTSVRKAVVITLNGNILTAEALFLTTEGNGFTYTEAGLFTGPFAAGSMFARKTFNPIIKTSSFEMRFTWIVTFLVNPSGSGDCAGVALVGPSTVANETIYESLVGGEASVAATFDFAVGGGHIDFFLNGQRMVRSRQYIEANPPLAAPVGGPAGNKGVNLVGFTLNPGDVAYLVQRTIS